MAGSRRSDGEGTEIKLGKDGRYHASLSFGLKAGGKRDRRHVSGKTRGEVALKLRKLQEKRDAGLVPLAGASPTVAEWLRHWLDTIVATRLRPGTLYDYRSIVESRIVPAIGHHRLDRLQPEHVESFYASLMAPQPRLDAKTGEVVMPKALTASSVLKTHRVLSRALKVATARERVARNVCALVEPPSVIRVEVKPLTQDEAKQIIDAATGSRNAARWSVALALGLRQGEALGLLWEDVDLQTGALTVRRALERRTYSHGCDGDCGYARAGSCPARVGGGLVLGPPKSNASRRTIPIPVPLVAALKTHRAAQAAERLAAGSMWQDHGHVFATVIGGPIDPGVDHRAWKSLLKAAGVREARLHDARHTAATLLLTQGVAPRVAMEILGHSQISLTMNTYTHVMPEVSRDATNRVGAALWGASGTNEDGGGYGGGYRSGTGEEVERADLQSGSPNIRDSYVEPPVGVEPTTYALRVRCSGQLS
ncbi:MAG: int [Jatrophihabitans sp.]|nr:int [Jatrophihabitans sp.]